MKNPKVSVVVPFHWMENWPVMLSRCLLSIEAQSYKDYEIILVKHSTMPITSNRAIESAAGDLIKILYMDDYLAHGNSLQEIVDNIGDKEWLVSGCLHDDGTDVGNYHEPSYNEKIYTGANTIGSPSVLTMKRGSRILFDTPLSFLLDVDLYKRLYDKYGSPTFLNTPNVIIGLHPGQVSNTMSAEDKHKEFEYIQNKYGFSLDR